MTTYSFFRRGSDPSRMPMTFSESIGVRFVSSEPDALPELSSQYESTVPGLFIIGALAGYPLIKQAMNQGYEVVQTIVGKPVQPDELVLPSPADLAARRDPVLAAAIAMAGGAMTSEEAGRLFK